jgi:hypothetical protein
MVYHTDFLSSEARKIAVLRANPRQLAAQIAAIVDDYPPISAVIGGHSSDQ